MSEPVAGLDAGFLLTETSTMRWHVIGVLIVDPSTATEQFGLASIARLLELRLGQIEAFRKTVDGGPLGLWPQWSEAGEVDIADHLHRAEVPDDATMDDIANFVARLDEVQLDRSRPLWEMHVVESMAGGRAAVVAKLHHALADGVSAVGILAALLDLEPLSAGPPAVDLAPAAPPEAPSLVDLPQLVARAGWHAARAGVRAAHRVVTEGRHSFGFLSARDPWHAPLTARRQVALGSLRFDDMLRAKNSYEVTFNTMVLATVTTALREWLHDNDQLPDRSLLATLPVSIRDGESTLSSRNQVSAIFVSLPVHIADSAKRIQMIDDDMSKSKALHGAAGETTLGDLAAVAPWPTLGLLWRAARRAGAARLLPPATNLVLSSVPGPPVPLYLAGAKLTGLHPLGPLLEGVPLNLTAVSYAGCVDIGIVSCPDVLPDITSMAAHLEPALANILDTAPLAGQAAE
ncbi:MAG: wax ester/triacylglycerol synthase family O-acyltransferase [Actinomycetota bacterium]